MPTFRSASGDLAFPHGLMHVASFTADERFIGFDFARQFAAVLSILHCQPNSMEHKPSGLLSNSQGTAEFPGANTLLRSCNHPYGGEPLIKTNSRILKQGASLERELLPTLGALPDTSSLQEHRLVRFAMRTDDAFGPARVRRLIQRGIHVGICFDRLQKSAGVLFHDSSMSQNHGCVKYIFTF